MKEKHTKQPSRQQLNIGLRIVTQQATRAYARFGGAIDRSDLVNAGFGGLERGYRSYVQGRADLAVHLRRNVSWAIGSAVRSAFRRRKRLLQLRRDFGIARPVMRGRSVNPTSARDLECGDAPPGSAQCGYRPGDTPETLLEERQRHESVRAAIEGLEPELASLIRERYLNQRQMQEVRADLKLNATRATRMHRRARARLRAVLHSHEPE